MNYQVEIKRVYTEIIVSILYPIMFKNIKDLFDTAEKTTENGKVIMSFQKLLKEIGNWSEITVKDNADNIRKNSVNVNVENLFRAVVKAYIILLSHSSVSHSLQFLNDEVVNTLDFNMFIHKCYKEAAAKIYSSPFLFSSKIDERNLTSFEIIQNKKKAAELIKLAIVDAIHGMLPMDKIIQDFLNDPITNANEVKLTIDAINYSKAYF